MDALFQFLVPLLAIPTIVWAAIKTIDANIDEAVLPRRWNAVIALVLGALLSCVAHAMGFIPIPSANVYARFVGVGVFGAICSLAAAGGTSKNLLADLKGQKDVAP